MIGNDIVDLKLSREQSNWRRKGFLEKIFSAEEQEHILNSKEPENIIWRFWSMKEAAYKAHQRLFNLAPTLNPLKFECFLGSSEKGSVKNGLFGYEVFSETTPEYIYSEAFLPQCNFDRTSGLRIDISPSDLKKQVLKQFSKNDKTKRFPSLHILKDGNGIPGIFSAEKELETWVSLTHHGRFSAYILATPDKI